MSCCSSCNHGVPCNGLSGLPTGLDGLLGSLTLPPNQAGAAFELGVELSGYSVDHVNIRNTLEKVRMAVQQGGFVQIPVQVYSMAGFTDFNPFIVIKGNARYAHSSATHLQNAIISAVASVVGYDAGSVRFEIDTYDPATGETYTDPTMRRYDAPTGSATTPPPDVPKPFQWPDFIQNFALEMNVSNGTAAAILAGGGLLGLLVVKKTFL